MGIIGNNGVLFSDSSQKAAQFIQLCNKIDMPIVFLQNITGYMVGRQYEHGGIVKHGSQMINAVSNSRCPTSPSSSARATARATTAWAGAPTTPLRLHLAHREDLDHGPEAARGGDVDRAPRRRAGAPGGPFDEEEDARLFAAVEDRAERESLALYATGRVADDGIIDPRDTRTVLGIALSAVHGRPPCAGPTASACSGCET